MVETAKAAEPVPEPTASPKTPDELIQAIWKQDAKFAQCILKGENAGKKPRAENKNRDGSLDRGIFQINSRTWPSYTNEPFDKAFDAELNIRVALAIFKARGVQPWYGQKCK